MVGAAAAMAVANHAAETNKIFMLSLSAGFIPQFFKEPLAEILPYCDFVFGNESEAAIYGEQCGWGKDVATVALKLAAQVAALAPQPRVFAGHCGIIHTIGFTVENFLRHSHAEPV